MATPKGTRAICFSVNGTDAVHVYSDATRIWLQIRRSIPTVEDIGTPSFKVAVKLTARQAIALAGELLTASTCHPDAPGDDVSADPGNPARVPASGKPVNLGKPWMEDEERRLTEAFDAGVPIPEIVRAHGRGPGGVRSRLIKLGKVSFEQDNASPLEPAGENSGILPDAGEGAGGQCVR